MRMKPPTGGGQFTHNGVTHHPDAKGFVDVPPEAEAEAVSHGYSHAPLPPPAGAAEPAAPAASPEEVVSTMSKGQCADYFENLELDPPHFDMARPTVADWRNAVFEHMTAVAKAAKKE